MADQQPDQSRQDLMAQESVQKAFKKGNINFDFLQPEEGQEIPKEEDGTERRNISRAGKRGLFNRGRPAQPIKKGLIYLWSALCAGSLFGVGGLVFAKSFMWLLAVPFLLSTFLWSLVMLTLFFARPR